MKKIILLIFLVGTSLFALDLNSLLDQINKSTKEEILFEKLRTQKFVNNKNDQKKLLKQAKHNLKKENKLTTSLKNIIAKNEKLLTLKETELSSKLGTLGEMFGNVRQISTDFLTNQQNSVMASEFVDNSALFLKLSNSKELPDIESLKLFWHSMLEEIIQSGNVSQYEADVIANNGEKKRQLITRIGVFSAFSQGSFLKYSKDVNSLMELVKQPKSEYQENALIFENSSNEIKSILIDPTRGTLFDMLKNKPSLMDKVKQGGVVGYVIMFLGAIGICFGIYSIIILNLLNVSIKKQIKELPEYSLQNSLGRITDVFHKYSQSSSEALEIKISEAILKETNGIKKGHSFLKLLAAVTPLLGLLGTVTGMITTFQSITLFGTGDPKLMAGGISTALVTTVLGLVTAIPLLFIYTYLSSKSEEILSILEEQSIGMIAKNIK